MDLKSLREALGDHEITRLSTDPAVNSQRVRAKDVLVPEGERRLIVLVVMRRFA